MNKSPLNQECHAHFFPIYYIDIHFDIYTKRIVGFVHIRYII